MPSDPAIQEVQDILADQARAIKQANDDEEKDLRTTQRKYSVQARADNAPWSSNVPGLGPGLFEGLWGNGLFLNMGAQADEAPPWSIYPMMRDRYLDKLWKSETIISGTLYSMTARFGSLPYKVDGPTRAKQRANDMMHGFNAKQWALDLLTCDNGAFVEKIGPGRPDKPLNKNLMVGLSVMDSLQCWRSFDPEFPVIYINPYTAAYHKIHYSRVLMASSMPSNRELARGIGISAMSRTLRAVQIMRDIEIYKHEKIGGRFKRGIGMIAGKGVTPGRVNDTLDDHDKKQDTVGLTRFSQIPFLLVPDGDAKISITDLAGLPDGFNAKDDTDLYVNCIALGFGIDTREIWPATQTGATKGDATVQHEKARGKGNGDLITTAERILNWAGTPDDVTVLYDYTDDEQDLSVSQIHTVKITNVGLMQAQSNITPVQGTAILVAEGIIDPEILTIQGAEESESATDTDPDSGDETGEPVATPTAAPGTQTQPAQNGAKPAQGNAATPVPGMGTPKTQNKAVKASKSKPIEYYVDEYRDQLMGLMDDVDPDDIEASVAEIKKKFSALLRIGLSAAALIGLANNDPSEKLIDKLKDIVKTSLIYFDGFVSDLQSAVSNPPPETPIEDVVSPFVARIGMYSGDFWQAAWVGVGNRSGSQRIRRVLDPAAAHCSDCPPKAKIYPDFDTMEAEAGIPGDTSNSCGGNCRCGLEVETSPGVFQKLFGSPDVYTMPILPIYEN